MYHYKLIIAYDGTHYHGWQAQKNLPCVAGIMQETFKKIFGRPIVLRGASRTDAGVHALGQVAMFKTDLKIDVDQMKNAWNNRLPNDITIRSIQGIDPLHNIYNNIVSKTYYYHFFLERPLPFVQAYGWYIHQPVDLEKLKQGLQIFVGTHNFRSFCSNEDTRENMIRSIDSIHVEKFTKWGIYRIVVTGPAFLRHMIRRIVGAALTVAYQKSVPIDVLKIALDKKNPVQILPNAPPQGLVLYKITYGKNDYDKK